MALPKNADEHIMELRAALAANDACGTTHYNLGVALMGKQQYDEAEGCFNEAIGCSPSLAEAFVQLGGIALQRGDLDGCLYYNTRATKARAGFAPGWANIGFVHLQKGEGEKAVKALTKAIVYNSKFIQAYVTLANAYMMMGLFDESIAACEKALQLEPDFPIAHHNISIAYLQKGEYAKAVEHSDKAVAMGYEVPQEILGELKEHRA